MSFETRKKVTAPRQDITGSPNIYSLPHFSPLFSEAFALGDFCPLCIRPCCAPAMRFPPDQKPRKPQGFR
ncbi:MAG: hypothetical protein JRI33_01110 [Deltaproteobacteria bacterium]|nr:hypothetical protein [Deltaproteobacteria bacterium]